MLLISGTKTDGAPAGNNLIKWLLNIEQIAPKKIFFLNREENINQV